MASGQAKEYAAMVRLTTTHKEKLQPPSEVPDVGPKEQRVDPAQPKANLTIPAELHDLNCLDLTYVNADFVPTHERPDGEVLDLLHATPNTLRHPNGYATASRKRDDKTVPWKLNYPQRANERRATNTYAATQETPRRLVPKKEKSKSEELPRNITGEFREKLIAPARSTAASAALTRADTAAQPSSKVTLQPTGVQQAGTSQALHGPRNRHNFIALRDHSEDEVHALPAQHAQRLEWRAAQPGDVVNFRRRSSVLEFLMTRGSVLNAMPSMRGAMFTAAGPNHHNICHALAELGNQYADALPGDSYRAIADALNLEDMQDAMVSDVMAFESAHRDPELASAPAIPLRTAENRVRTASRLAEKAAENAKARAGRMERGARTGGSKYAYASAEAMAQARREALLARRYADLLREMKRFITTHAAPYHFAHAGEINSKRLGESGPYKVDEGTFKGTTIGVSGGAKAGIAKLLGSIRVRQDRSDFDDIDGDHNTIDMSGVELSFSAREGWDNIVSIYLTERATISRTRGRYLAHADRRAHFDALFQNYVHHPHRTRLLDRLAHAAFDHSAASTAIARRAAVERVYATLDEFFLARAGWRAMRPCRITPTRTRWTKAAMPIACTRSRPTSAGYATRMCTDPRCNNRARSAQRRMIWRPNKVHAFCHWFARALPPASRCIVSWSSGWPMQDSRATRRLRRTAYPGPKSLRPLPRRRQSSPVFPRHPTYCQCPAVPTSPAQTAR